MSDDSNAKNTVSLNRADSFSSNNNEVMEDAGKIHLDEGQIWGTGIVNDFKTTVLAHWWKEMINFNQKTVAVTLLMFISVISPTLTFGAVYGKETGNQIGAVETILATTWVGVAYALLSGMPMCIIGSTGPVLAFTKAVVRISENMGVPFLTFQAWASVWLFFYCCLASFFDMARVIKLCTRFTDEVFALLIVSIFVMDAVGDPFSQVGILRYFDPNHKWHQEDDNVEDPEYNYIEVALLSTLIGFGTTMLIFFFRYFKTSPFFCNQGIRTSIHDFAVTLAVLSMTLVKEFLFTDIETEGLNVPEKFQPTFQCCDSSCETFFPDDCMDQAEAYGSRPWFVSFSDLNGKGFVPIVAAGPGILAFLLVFLDSGITWHLVNHPNNNLKHGEAYNYDLVLVGFFNMVNGALGLPWLVGTTVPCIIHFNSLAERDSKNKVIDVQETRLTGLFAHLLVGLSLLFLSLLQLIPMPVLYGVFLFMGVSALPAMQFWNRILLWFMETSKYPEFVFTKYMEKKRIHIYTIVELFFFGLIFMVQNTQAISIIFPLMTLLCIPGRTLLLPRIFEGWELCLLDGDDMEIDAWVAAKEKTMASMRDLEDYNGEMSDSYDDNVQAIDEA